MKRKVVASALVGLLVLCACSSSGGKKADDQATKALGGGGLRIKIAMVTHSAQGDAFWDIVQKGAQSASAKDNVQFLYAADPDGGKQAPLVQSYIDQPVDGIIVTQAKPDALKDVGGGAGAAGGPGGAGGAGAGGAAEGGARAH